MPDFKVWQDFFDDARIVDKAEDAKAAAAFRTSQRIDKIHFANEARPGASAETGEVVVRRGFGARSRHRSEGSHVLQPALAAGFVAIVSIIASKLESFFRDEGSQSGEGVQGGEPFRCGRV